MPRGNQLERQWKILSALMAGSRAKTAQELADLVESNLRNVYRDLEVLQTAGFPICNDRNEAGKKAWSILETYKSRVPLPLDLSELMALYFSLGMLRAMHDSVFYGSLESLFQKISATLPPESARYLQNFQKAVSVDQKQYRNYGRLNHVIRAANDAITRGRSLEMLYCTLHRKKTTKRLVDPYRISFINGTFYLIGYCHLRSDVRTFVLDRIKNLHVTEHAFSMPGDFNIDDFLSGSFGAYCGTPEQVGIVFSPDIAGYIREKIWHKSQKITPRQDGSILFEARVAVNEEFQNWVLSWGSHALVLEPPELGVAVRREAERMLKAYRAAGSEN